MGGEGAALIPRLPRPANFGARESGHAITGDGEERVGAAGGLG